MSSNNGVLEWLNWSPEIPAGFKSSSQAEWSPNARRICRMLVNATYFLMNPNNHRALFSHLNWPPAPAPPQLSRSAVIWPPRADSRRVTSFSECGSVAGRGRGVAAMTPNLLSLSHSPADEHQLSKDGGEDFFAVERLRQIRASLNQRLRRLVCSGCHFPPVDFCARINESFQRPELK